MLVSALAINRIKRSQTYRLRSLIFEQKFFASILDFSLVFFSLVLVLSSILLLKKSSTSLGGDLCLPSSYFFCRLYMC